MKELREDSVYSRREAIQRVSAMLGTASFVGGTTLLSGCIHYNPASADRQDLFSNSDIALLDEIADTILPDTDTPGAKAAEVGTFIAVMVADTYYPPQQRVVREGLLALEKECLDTYGSTFIDITPAQRFTLVTKLDREQFDYMIQRPADQPVHYFRMIKELTLFGYFTSEIGYTQAMRYVESPGRFDPCIDLKSGDTIWADHA